LSHNCSGKHGRHARALRSLRVRQARLPRHGAPAATGDPHGGSPAWPDSPKARCMRAPTDARRRTTRCRWRGLRWRLRAWRRPTSTRCMAALPGNSRRR
jgi:hypothetical protein